jgi:hypothetical protein
MVAKLRLDIASKVVRGKPGSSRTRVVGVHSELAIKPWS